ncbi:MAG: RelA/SpoT family protein [Candidatus Nanoarchaeia archaeon]
MKNSLTQIDSFEELKDKIKKHNPKADMELIDKAFKFTRELHGDQKRVSGEPYYIHPVEVANILADLRVSSSTICAALLHDVVEDTSVTLDKLKKEFGKDIASLVEGLTNIDKLNFNSLEVYKAENIRKMLIATTKDVRIILIKLADRLHNMRTLGYFREEKQKRIAQETLEIYAPVAHKLGMWNMKGELEDLSLRYLHPDVYKFLREKINEKRDERENTAKELIKTIQTALKKKSVYAQVYGRAKYFYSIYKKMIKKSVDFNEIYDLIGIRIITNTIPECYTALGVVHELWKPLPKRFKDFIATPKSNGYQSLHTAVVGSHGKVLEIQIRTEQMHRIAEEGIAAHWRYHGTESDKKFEKKISWLKQLLEWKSTSSDAKDFIEILKFDLFDKEIVVFTPKGDPILLPEGATPVDFAYMVHSNIGNKCSKALINTKMSSLDTKLKAGDVIEIVTTKDAKPSRSWLSFVKTSKSKSKIRQELGIQVEHDPKKKKEEPEGTSEKFLINHIKVEDNVNAPIKISKCCYPGYKIPIVGFLTKDKKLTVHSKDCPNIHTLDQSKKVNLSWVTSDLTNYRIIKINVKDRVGILIDILKEVSSQGVNILHVSSDTSKENSLITLKVERVDEKRMKELLESIRQVEDVVGVNELKENSN